MCGIVGRWALAADQGLAEAVQRIAHRGPDGRGQYCDASAGVALGHVRLAILDPTAAGDQPMHADDGSAVLVFNGEIYNFRELRAELESQGVAFHSHSDTEVLLALYQRDGAAMLPKLNGIFAFALYDRHRGELLLARDALGVKPLYLSQGADGVVFASEIKAMWPLLPPAASVLDAAAIHRYLTFLWCPGDATPVLDIRKLQPGHAVLVKAGRIERQWAWYELPARRGVRADLGREASVAAVEHGLRAAVHRQLVSDVPIGAFLSGGLDSSAVVAFARERVPGLRCFTIETTGAHDPGAVDDLPYARQVATHLGVALDVVTIDAARMAADLQQMVEQLDEPLADPAALNVLYISQLARQQGIKVLLSGTGGDDLFTGYRRHLALRYEGAWQWLPKGARGALAGISSGLDQRRAWARRLQRLFAHASESDDARLAGYFSWIDDATLRSLYSPDLRSAVAQVRADQPMLDFLDGIPPEASRMQRLLALEQRFFLADHNLTYTDKMSMAAGVEVRVPFLDLELVELAARIPDAYKQRGRIGKWVLKQAMQPYLPRHVIHRPKTGFGAPLRHWMRHELKDWLSELLSERSLRRRGLFDPVAVQRLIDDNDAGRRDASYTLLSLACIEIWCRASLDGRR